MRALADRTAQRAGEGKGTGGKGGNARPEGDSRVSCCIRLLAYLILEFISFSDTNTQSAERLTVSNSTVRSVFACLLSNAVRPVRGRKGIGFKYIYIHNIQSYVRRASSAIYI
jgi:hypothetical protein